MSPGHKAYDIYREVMSTYNIGSPAWGEISLALQAVWERFAERVWGEAA